MLRGLLNVIYYRELIRALVHRDLKIRYRSSVLGYAWTWLDPLMTMLVFLFVFSVVLETKIEHFPVYLLCGLVPWIFFSNSVNGSVKAITGNTAIIKKVYYPREIFPLVTIFSNGINMLLSILVLVPVVLIFKIPLTPKILLLPIPAFFLLILAYGAALIVSILNVFFRDMVYIVPFVTRLLFFLTPVFYRIEGRVPERMYGTYMLLNPLATILTFFRSCLMGLPLPDWRFIGAVGVISLLVVGIGYESFKRLEDSLVKRI